MLLKHHLITSDFILLSFVSFVTVLHRRPFVWSQVFVPTKRQNLFKQLLQFASSFDSTYQSEGKVQEHIKRLITNYYGLQGITNANLGEQRNPSFVSKYIHILTFYKEKGARLRKRTQSDL